MADKAEKYAIFNPLSTEVQLATKQNVIPLIKLKKQMAYVAKGVLLKIKRKIYIYYTVIIISLNCIQTKML